MSACERYTEEQKQVVSVFVASYLFVTQVALNDK